MEYTIYSISNHTCAGNAETSINTGLKLCSSLGISEWKIEFDFTTQTISAAQQSYIRCRHETSPYPGVCLRSNTANGPTQIQINSNSTTVATGNNTRCTGSITRSGSTITVVFNGTTFSKTFTNHESPLTFGGELEDSVAGTWKSGRFSNIVINSIRIIQYASYSIPMEAFMWSRRRAMTYIDEYIVFADPEVEQICATNWGDGIGLTKRLASKVTNSQFGFTFRGNTSITSFDELKYFTGLTQLSGNNSSSTPGAFGGCSNLVSITIPENVTALMHYAIYNCASLEEVTLPHAINAGYSGNFDLCPSLIRFNIPSSIDWYNTSFRNTNGFHSSTNGGRLYSNGVEITHVDVPSGVTTVKGGTYNKCIGITSATLPSSVTDISNYAFQNCTALKSLYIEGKISLGASQSFQSCSSLKHLYFLSLSDLLESSWNTTTGGYRHPFDVSGEGHVYVNNQEVTSIVTPNIVTFIGDKALKNCKEITSITIGNNVTSIGVQAFYNCSALTTVVFPSNASSSLTSIDSWAFKESNITGTLALPNTITTLGQEVFRLCSGLTGTLVLPSTLSSIGTYCFADCSGFTGTLEIPASLTTIPNGNVFAGMGRITKVIIPSTMTSIGNYTFYNCWSLSEVVVNATTPPTLGTGVFNGNASGRKIYVPYSADHSVLAAYQSSWSTYASYIYELNPDGTIPT